MRHKQVATIYAAVINTGLEGERRYLSRRHIYLRRLQGLRRIRPCIFVSIALIYLSARLYVRPDNSRNGCSWDDAETEQIMEIDGPVNDYAVRKTTNCVGVEAQKVKIYFNINFGSCSQKKMIFVLT